MDYYSKQIRDLIDELSKLPGIGTKSAQRLAFHILNMPQDNVARLSETLMAARQNVRYCTYRNQKTHPKNIPSFVECHN